MGPTTDLQNTQAVIALFDQAAGALRGGAGRRGSIVSLPARGRLLASGDLHDHQAHLDKILRAARLEQSPDHHVVLQELVHGGHLINGIDFSYRILARAALAVTVYADQVHIVPGNHELAQCTGRSVSKGAGDSVGQFRAALEYIFGSECDEVEAAIGRFIRAMPLAVLGGAEGAKVLCAHSLPAPAMMKRFDAGILERELTEEDYRAPHGSAYLMVWGRQHTAEQVEQLARRWGVKLFCLGHEHADTGVEMHGPRHVVLNSDHERATVLPIDLADVPSAEQAMFAAIPLNALA